MAKAVALPRLGLSFGRENATIARAFLDALGGPGASFTFQTFVDRAKGDPPPSKNDPRSRIIPGTLDQVARTLADLNDQRAGVFVTVNPQRGDWRANVNTIKPRALWHENDGTLPDNVRHAWPIEPSMVVRTRENHTHIYWLLNDLPGTPQEWAVWEGIERHLVEKRLSDPQCMKRCQVLRVPGFYHCKDPTNPRLVTLEQPDNGKRYSLGIAEQAFPPVGELRVIETKLTQVDLDTHGIADIPLVTDVQWRDIVAMLDYVNPDAPAVPTGEGDGTRSRWLKVLMVLEGTKHPERRLIADEWSRCGGSRDRVYAFGGPITEHRGYIEGEVEHQMGSFKREDGPKVALGTLIRYAREGGWPGWSSESKREDEDWLTEGEAASVRVDTFIHTGGDEALVRVAPAQNFLLDGFMSGEGTMSAILGPGGIGKSKLVKGIACSIAAGVPAFGHQMLMPHEVGAAVIADLENNQHEFTRRLQDQVRAMVEHGQIRREDAIEIMRNVRHLYIDRMIFQLAFQQHSMPIRHNRHYNAIYDALSRARDACRMAVRWLCFDALYKFHLLEENNQQHMLYILETLDELATKVFGASVPRSFVHHSAKSNTSTSAQNSTGQTARGAGSITASIRSSVAVRGLTEEEMLLHGIGPNQWREFAMVYVDKSNFRVMKPDSFMVRSFGGAWWYARRDVASQPMDEETSEGFMRFLVRMYELVVLRKVELTSTSALRNHNSFLGGSQKELKHYLAVAEVEGHITKNARGKYMWAGTRPEKPHADIGELI